MVSDVYQHWEHVHLIQELIQLAHNIEEKMEIALLQVHRLQQQVVLLSVAQMHLPHILQIHNVIHFHIYVLQMGQDAYYQALVKPDHQHSAAKEVHLAIQEQHVLIGQVAQTIQHKHCVYLMPKIIYQQELQLIIKELVHGVGQLVLTKYVQLYLIP